MDVHDVFSIHSSLQSLVVKSAHLICSFRLLISSAQLVCSSHLFISSSQLVCSFHLLISSAQLVCSFHLLISSAHLVLYLAWFDMELEERSVDFFDNIDAHPSPQELGAPPRPAEIVDPAVYEKSLRSCCHRKRWAAMPQN